MTKQRSKTKNERHFAGEEFSWQPEIIDTNLTKVERQIVDVILKAGSIVLYDETQEDQVDIAEDLVLKGVIELSMYTRIKEDREGTWPRRVYTLEPKARKLILDS